MSLRANRVGEQMKKELGEIISQKLRIHELVLSQ